MEIFLIMAHPDQKMKTVHCGNKTINNYAPRLASSFLLKLNTDPPNLFPAGTPHELLNYFLHGTNDVSIQYNSGHTGLLEIFV